MGTTQKTLIQSLRNMLQADSDNLESIVESAENMDSVPGAVEGDEDGMEQAESTIMTESDVLIETVDGVIKQSSPPVDFTAAATVLDEEGMCIACCTCLRLLKDARGYIFLTHGLGNTKTQRFTQF